LRSPFIGSVNMHPTSSLPFLLPATNTHNNASKLANLPGAPEGLDGAEGFSDILQAFWQHQEGQSAAVVDDLGAAVARELATALNGRLATVQQTVTGSAVKSSIEEAIAAVLADAQSTLDAATSALPNDLVSVIERDVSAWLTQSQSAVDAATSALPNDLVSVIEGAVSTWLTEMSANVATNDAVNIEFDSIGETGAEWQASNPELAYSLDDLRALLQGDPAFDGEVWIASLRNLLTDGVSLNANMAENSSVSSAPPALLALLSQLPAELRSRLQAWADAGKALPQIAAEPDSMEADLLTFDDMRTLSNRWAEPQQTSTIRLSGTQAPAAPSLPDPPSAEQEMRQMIANLAKAEAESAAPLDDVEALRQPSGSLPEGVAARLAHAVGAMSAPAAAPNGFAAPGANPSNPAALPAIPVPPGDHAWGKALGERVLWMVGKDMQSAEVRLTPPQLGPVEIRVSVQNDQASVSFSAAHPFTREALEAALPRLRDMLGESNLQLVDVNVGDGHGSRDQAGRGGDGGRASGVAGGWGDGDEALVEDTTLPTRRAGLGLVDYFA
jgi:flagellar hook-length control protein FliK